MKNNKKRIRKKPSLKTRLLWAIEEKGRHGKCMKAYKVLNDALESDDLDLDTCTIAMEEAIGWLGEVLND